MSKFYFVIDTDTYAGNFERQMCAYITGVVGECGVGERFAELARKELSRDEIILLEDCVDEELDEGGCRRPCKIYPTTGFYNNGFGFQYVSGEENKAIEAFRKRCIEYGDRKCYSYNDAQEEHRKRWYDKADNAENEYGHHPSYQSVAIVLNTFPEDAVIDIIKNRAKKFEKKCKEFNGGIWQYDFNIIGMRIINERTITAETAVE